MNFEIIKNLWLNPKLKSLIILSTYIIFFVVLFQSFEKPSTIPLSGIDLFKNNTNYSYMIEGEHSFLVNNNLNVYYNDIEYDFNFIPEELKVYHLDIYTPLNISKMIDDSILEATNYIENYNVYVYEQTKFNRFINLDVADEFQIKIITYLKDNNFYKVEIIFKEYSLIMDVI